MLLGINGIGPRLALSILAGLPVERLLGAIRGGELAVLVGIPGVGKKTAERMLIELRDTVGKLLPPGRPVRDDLAVSDLPRRLERRRSAESVRPWLIGDERGQQPLEQTR